MMGREIFRGGFPGETYSQGVRRRVRSGLIAFGSIAVSFAVVLSVFKTFGSTWLTIACAGLLGVVGAVLNPRFETLPDGPLQRGDTTVWFLLFVPAAIVLAAATIYAGARAQSGMDILRACLVAYLLGSIVGFTKVLFGLRSESSEL